MLSDATSGLKCAHGFTRSSTVIVGAPPVVMFTTTSHARLIFFRNGAKASGRWSGRPSRGSRACRCTIAAPASQAPIAASAISSAVMGKYGDIDGVWIAPVTAQVMTTLRRGFVAGFPAGAGFFLQGDMGWRVWGCRRAFARHEPGEPVVAPAALPGDPRCRGRAIPCLRGELPPRVIPHG